MSSVTYSVTENLVVNPSFLLPIKKLAVASTKPADRTLV